MIIKKIIDIEYLNDIYNLINNDKNLHESDGNLLDKDWIQNCIFDNRCFVFGSFIDNQLISITITEKLSHNGCLLWYIVTDNNYKNNGYGSQLLEFLENYLKYEEFIEWIFLSSTENAISFYNKNNYKTTNQKTIEYIKYI